MHRPDFSQYVVHFTKSKAPFAISKHPDDEIIKSISQGNAYKRLVNILEKGHIYSTPMPWTNKKAVAFTECPWWSLLEHATRYSAYGVGFLKECLFAAGGGPAIYLRQDLHEKQKEHFVHKVNSGLTGFDADLYAFVTPFVPEYASAEMKTKFKAKVVDYTHEREWRVPSDFKFALEDVQFVIVDSYEDVAKFPKKLKDAIGRERFVMMEVYRQIERFWPTHYMPSSSK